MSGKVNPGPGLLHLCFNHLLIGGSLLNCKQEGSLPETPSTCLSNYNSLLSCAADISWLSPFPPAEQNPIGSFCFLLVRSYPPLTLPVPSSQEDEEKGLGGIKGTQFWPHTQYQHWFWCSYSGDRLKVQELYWPRAQSRSRGEAIGTFLMQGPARPPFGPQCRLRWPLGCPQLPG